MNRFNMTSKSDENQATKINSFEDIIDMAGSNGCRKITIYTMASLVAFVFAMPVFSYQFLGATPQHWCLVEHLVQSNWTQDQIKEIAIPYENKSKTFSECEMFDLDYATLSYRPFNEVLNDVLLGQIERNSSVACERRQFEPHAETIVNKWDLVCSRRYLYSSTQAAIQGGMLIGSIFSGYLIDRFGRTFIYRITAVVSVFVGFATAFSPNIFVFIVLRMFGAMLSISMYMAIFVLCMEISSVKQRAAVGSYVVIPWAFGMMLTAGIAYLVRPWFYLQIAITIPTFILIINIWFFPESPRWLILRGRHEEALKVLQEFATSNGRQLPPQDDIIKAMQKIENKNAPSDSSSTTPSCLSRVRSVFTTLASLVVDKRIRMRTLAFFFCWFVIAMVYYGVSLASSSLSTDPYLYIFLSGLIEVPSYLIIWPCVAAIGRRKLLIVLLLTCSLSIVSVMALVLADEKDEYSTLRLLLFLLGKFAITAAFQVIWFYTTEVYPTDVRSLIVGESSAVGRCGSICSPFINDLLSKKASWSPSAVFSVASALAAVVAISFPEPSGRNMADSVRNLIEEEPSEEENAK